MRQGLADTLQLLGTIQTFAVSNSSRSRASVPLDWLNCSALLDSIQTRTYSSAGSRAPPQLHVCSPPTRARQLISTLRHPREVRQVQYGIIMQCKAFVESARSLKKRSTVHAFMIRR